MSTKNASAYAGATIPACAFQKPEAGSEPQSAIFDIGGSVDNAVAGFERLTHWKEEINTQAMANGDADSKFGGNEYIVHESSTDPKGDFSSLLRELTL